VTLPSLGPANHDSYEFGTRSDPLFSSSCMLQSEARGFRLGQDIEMSGGTCRLSCVCSPLTMLS